MESAYNLAMVLATHDHDYAWGGGWWLWGLLKLALIGVLLFALFRGFRSRRFDGMSSARTILAERYARGELNADEYKERLERLK